MGLADSAAYREILGNKADGSNQAASSDVVEEEAKGNAVGTYDYEEQFSYRPSLKKLRQILGTVAERKQ